MRQKAILAASVVLCFVLAAALVQNYRAQQATNTRLNTLQHQLDQQASAPRAPAAVSPAPKAVAPAGPLVIDQSTNLPTEYAQRQHDVEQVMAAGWTLINQRTPEAGRQAADLFAAATRKIDAASPDLYNGLGRALLIAGKPREAIAAWRKGLAIQPRLADMQSGIGWGYWRLNDPYRAREAWQKAAAIDPKSPDAWSALAWIDLALGDKADAVRGFKALVDLDPKNRSWVIGLAMARAGNTDLAQIRLYFGLPDPAAFKTPAADDPATMMAAENAAP